jgi:hypothetical protein
MALSKTETAILACAARREHRNLLPLPRFIYVRGLSIVIALEKLARLGLIEEKPAGPGDPVWRQGRTPTTLVLSQHGLDVLNAAGPEPEAWIGAMEPEAAPMADPQMPAIIGEDDRHWVLMAIMSRPQGADVKSIQRETGMPLQTIRAAISGLRSEGYMFDHVREADGTITYQLIGWMPGDGGLENTVRQGALHS